MKYNKIFTEVEALLQTAIGLPGCSIKAIATEAGIKTSTLYQWNTANVHQSPQKADALLLYFIQHGPERLKFVII